MRDPPCLETLTHLCPCDIWVPIKTMLASWTPDITGAKEVSKKQGQPPVNTQGSSEQQQRFRPRFQQATLQDPPCLESVTLLGPCGIWVASEPSRVPGAHKYHRGHRGFQRARQAPAPSPNQSCPGLLLQTASGNESSSLTWCWMGFAF